MVAPEQCRAARGWAGLSQQELATSAGIGLSTLRAFEAGQRTLIRNNMDALQRAIAAAGVRLLFEDGKPAGIAMAGTRLGSEGPSAAGGDASAP
jgi:hypothetical protein